MQTLGNTAAIRHTAFTENAGDFGFGAKGINSRLLRAQSGFADGVAGSAAEILHMLPEDKEQKRKKNITAKIIASTIQPTAKFTSSYAGSDIDVTEMSLNDERVSSKNGVIKVDGKNITTKQGVKLADNAHICTIEATQEEIDTNAYLRGETDEIPASFKAELKENDITNPSRSDVRAILDKKLQNGELPRHVHARITSLDKLEAGKLPKVSFSKEGGILNSLSPKRTIEGSPVPADDKVTGDRTATSSVSSEIKAVPKSIQGGWKAAANTQPENMSPAPEQAPNFTPAPAPSMGAGVGA